MTVLLFLKNEQSFDIYKTFLSGIDIICTSSVDAIKNQLEMIKIDAILVDLEDCSEMKTFVDIFGYCDERLIFIISDDSDLVETECEYIVKPFEVSELKEKLGLLDTEIDLKNEFASMKKKLKQMQKTGITLAQTNDVNNKDSEIIAYKLETLEKNFNTHCNKCEEFKKRFTFSSIVKILTATTVAVTTLIGLLKLVISFIEKGGDIK
jgi:hypothetical protein